MHNKIFLTGFMGSGKSEIGRLLSKKLKIKFIDTDDVIESKYKRTITQIFDEFGEDKFRDIELETISDLIQNKESSVISLGGGSLVNQQNLDIVIKSGLLIYIKSGLEEIWDRINNNTKRPLLLVNGKFPSKEIFIEKSKILLEERQKSYDKAQVIINCDEKEIEEIVEEIIRKIDKN
jgi:shikimate kinase